MTYENRSYSPGDVLTLHVSRLEAIQIVSNEDLSGTVIISDNPIGVISGDSCGASPGSYCDVLLEQNILVSNWGTIHIYSATGRQTGRSKYRMIAFYNRTAFNFNNIDVILDLGEYIDFDLRGNGVIVSTKPASLFQIITQIDGRTVDPSLIQVPTENQFALMLGFTTPTRSAADRRGFINYVNIIVKSNETSSLRLNGKHINSTTASRRPYVVHEDPIPGSDYHLIIVRLPRAEDLYFITQERDDHSPMSAIAYGYQSYESYGYATGLLLPTSLLGGPPYPPTLNSSITNFNTSSCSADISIFWFPSKNRTIDRYFLFMNGSPLVTSNTNANHSYNHSAILNLNTNYQYSITASNCPGNSTNSYSPLFTISSYSFLKALHLPTECLMYYNNITGELVINWRLSTPTQPSGVSGVEIGYYLLLLYSHSRQEVTHTYTKSTRFSQSSSILSHNTTLIPHNFTQNDDVETSIAASLVILKQCGVRMSGPEMACKNSFRTAIIPTHESTKNAPQTSTAYMIGINITGILLLISLVLIIILFVSLCVTRRKNKKLRRGITNTSATNSLSLDPRGPRDPRI